MTADTLRSHTAKDLAQMARQNGVAGWHAMRKEELVQALVQLARGSRPTSNGELRGSKAIKQNTLIHPHQPDPKIRRKIDQLRRKFGTIKNLSAQQQASDDRRPREDRLVIMVRDPYWLHATWELSQRSIDRAQAALGQRWHMSHPILRVFRIREPGSSIHYRDITIHGGVTNWYVDVDEPPCEFRMEIGYLADDGVFYCVARSNSVQTPPAGSVAADDNWSDIAGQADRIYAMSGGYTPRGASRELQELLEERLRRPLGTPMHTRYGNGAAATIGSPQEQMPFAVDAEITVYGAVERDAHVTMQGEPVPLREDGTFSVRLNLPDRRQVIPIVASSSDGVEQRTIILAVERNTKVLESVMRDLPK